MNLKVRSIISTMTLVVGLNAIAATIVLDKKDFRSASESPMEEQSLILAKLSDSGVTKVKMNNVTKSDIEIRLAGEDHYFKLRDRIRADEIQFGPLDHGSAEKIVNEINGQ
jgi:hypothetical protein